MLKAIANFGRKKTSKPFKDYYKQWFHTLKKTLLPQLREAMLSDPISPSVLSTRVQSMQQHFQAYYNALDLAASDDIAQVLFPEWRNAVEKPFLWLGDLHPYLFINLFRSYLDDEETEDDEDEDVNKTERCYDIVMAYKNPSKKLTTRVDQIECTLRLMVPALVIRARKTQAAFVERVGDEWGKCQGRKVVVGDMVVAEMEELTGVFIEANRVRSSVLSEILSVTNVYQAAIFLQGLAQFLVGFRSNRFLAEFDKCEMAIN